MRLWHALLLALCFPAVAQVTATGTITDDDTVGGGSWSTCEAPTFVVGVPSVYSFEHCAPVGATDFAITSGTIGGATGIVLNSAQKRLTYDGYGTGSASIVLTDYDGTDDFDVRAADSGVFYAESFAWRDAAHTQAITSTANLITSSWWYSSIGMCGNADEAPVEFEQTIQLSHGGAFRVNQEAADDTWGAYCIGWDGPGVQTKNTTHSTMYFQVQIYREANGVNFFFNGEDQKYFELNAPNSSFQDGELVVDSEHFLPGGYWKAYTKLGAVQPFLLRWDNSPFSGAEYTYYTMYDRGTPTVTNLTTLQQRHGVTYTGHADSTDADSDLQHLSHMKIVPDGWSVFEVYVNFTSKVCKIWFAPRGMPAQLATGSMDCELPAPGTDDCSGCALVADLVSGAQLVTYESGTHNWLSQDSFIIYDEPIASTNPIDFPGFPGDGVPFPGTDAVTGYPPSGTTPQNDN